MNTERLFKIVVMDITNDQLKLEDELERTINADMDVSIKVTLIKSLLSRMSVNDASIARFTSMTEQSKENNNNPN